MIIVPCTDGGVRIQAWECTRRGWPTLLVYTLPSVLRMLGAGYDVEVIAVDRHADGRRSLHRGVLVLTDSDGRRAWASLAEGMRWPKPARTHVPVPGPEMAVDGRRALSGTPTLGTDSRDFPRSEGKLITGGSER